MASTNINGAPRGVVAIGSSAGGVEALTDVAGKLPADLSYPILIAWHHDRPEARRRAVCRYTELADEAEHAVTVVGRRLSEATSGSGERGDR